METPRLVSLPDRRTRVYGAFTGALLALLLTATSGNAAQKPQSKRASAAPAPASLPPALRQARWHVLGARPMGMYYYSCADRRGLTSLVQHASQMTLLGPQCFWLDHDGFVHGEIPPAVLEAARRSKLPLMPLVVNPGFDRPLAHAFLLNPRAQDRAAMYLAYLARRDGYVGWQLDLEYLDPVDKALYTRFVERVTARLHRDGRLVSVAVVPRFSDIYPDTSPAREFHTGEWGAPFDFRALGRTADFLALMTYDQYNSTTRPGPVAGYEWVKAALDYAVRRVPPAKLLLGIPFYGRNWFEAPQGPSSSPLAYQDIEPLLKRPDVERHWDERWRTTRLQFADAGGRRTAWFDDPRSLQEKLELMRAGHLRGFAAWRLGTEDPQFWPMLAEFQQAAPVRTRRAGKARAPRVSARMRRERPKDGS